MLKILSARAGLYYNTNDIHRRNSLTDDQIRNIMSNPEFQRQMDEMDKLIRANNSRTARRSTRSKTRASGNDDHMHEPFPRNAYCSDSCSSSSPSPSPCGGSDD